MIALSSIRGGYRPIAIDVNTSRPGKNPHDSFHLSRDRRVERAASAAGLAEKFGR